MCWVDCFCDDYSFLVIGRRLHGADRVKPWLQAPGRQGRLCGTGSAAEGREPGCLMIWPHIKAGVDLIASIRPLSSLQHLLPSLAQSMRALFLCSSGACFLAAAACAAPGCRWPAIVGSIMMQLNHLSEPQQPCQPVIGTSPAVVSSSLAAVSLTPV